MGKVAASQEKWLAAIFMGNISKQLLSHIKTANAFCQWQ
jgi:hypothetical protein